MKKGISLITLIITIIVIIILSAAVILTLNNKGTIEDAKIAVLASDYSSLQTSIALYFTNIVTSNLDIDFDKEKILLGQFDDSFRLVEKSGEEFVEAVINKNNEEINVYKLDEEICKSKGIEIPKTPSNECSWYISKEGLIYLVYNENSTISAWIIGNPPEGKQIENETLDKFVAKIGEWEKEPSIHDLIPVADATMFNYTTASNGTVSIKGFNTNYIGEIPTEIKFPTTDPNGNEIIGISSYAFWGNTNLTVVVIPEGMKVLEAQVFRECTSLKEVYLPATLTSIDSYPFYDCANIEKITVPNFITSNSTYYPNNIFTDSKTKINTVNFAGDITTIGKSAFAGFTALKNITIPNGVITIGRESFYGCTSLSGKITIPRSVTSIGYSAFSNCSNISEIEFLSEGELKTIDSTAFYNASSITSIKIPEGVETIGGQAFMKCTSLKEVYLPTTLTSIDTGIFSQSTEIEKITVPNFITSNSTCYPNKIFTDSKTKINTVNFAGDITTIGYGAFAGFTALKNITIPNGVITIGRESFYGCTSLSGKITIPRSVTSIGMDAFANCSNISEIEFLSEGELKTIGSTAFYNASSITSIIIPDGVEKIGIQAFRECTSLRTITIPNTVTSMDSTTFYGCNNLVTIVYSGSATGAPWGATNATVVSE